MTTGMHREELTFHWEVEYICTTVNSNAYETTQLIDQSRLGWNHRELWEPWRARGKSLPPAFVHVQPGAVLQISAELPSAPLGLTHVTYCPATLVPMVFLWWSSLLK